jgi:putative spermidine/putrescine transport system permease protein
LLIYPSFRSVITPVLAAVSVVYILVAAAAFWLLDKLVGLDIFLRSK